MWQTNDWDSTDNVCLSLSSQVMILRWQSFQERTGRLHLESLERLLRWPRFRSRMIENEYPLQFPRLISWLTCVEHLMPFLRNDAIPVSCPSLTLCCLRSWDIYKKYIRVSLHILNLREESQNVMLLIYMKVAWGQQQEKKLDSSVHHHHHHFGSRAVKRQVVSLHVFSLYFVSATASSCRSLFSRITEFDTFYSSYWRRICEYQVVFPFWFSVWIHIQNLKLQPPVLIMSVSRVIRLSLCSSSGLWH